jgi:iron complex outermembrane recepter protein
MRARFWSAWAATLASCILSAHAWAQPPTGGISGVVVAADGARLPGVSLVLTAADSGAVVRAVSAEAGGFRIRNLLPGRYALEATLEGFEPRLIDDIVVRDRQTVSVTVRLDVAILHESVRVLGSAPRDSLEASALRESGARDVGEALGALPGVSVLRKGAIAHDVVLRGFQGGDLAVLIDGERVDAACPSRMDPPAFHVDFAEVNRIEVSKGPFDVKNHGGLGGVVNIVTLRAQRGWHGSGTLGAASAATLAASAVTSFGADRWSVLGGASSRRADPYRDGSGTPLTARVNYRPEFAAAGRAYDIWTAWGRTSVVPRDGSLLHLSYTRQAAGMIAYPYLQMDGVADDAHRAGARLEVASLPGGLGALAAHAYHTRVDHWMTDEHRISSRDAPRGYSMATDAETTVSGMKAEVQSGPVSFGAEASRRRWNTRTLLAMRQYAPSAPLADATIDVAGAFVAASRPVGSRLQLEMGARLDHARSDLDRSLADTALYLAYFGTADTRATDLLPAGYARAAWQVRDGLVLTIGGGHGARLPDQQERYYALRRAGTDWVGNPGVSPGRNTGFDAFLHHARGGRDLGLAVFTYRVTDHLVLAERQRVAAVPGLMNSAARSYANVDAHLRGLEATVTVPLARQLFLSADGFVTRGTMTAPPGGDDLPEMPPARARVRLRYDDARWTAAAEVSGAARQDRVAAALGEHPTPAFAVVSVQAGLRVRRLDVSAGVDNLLDAFYAEHLSYLRDPFRTGTRVYEPGRTVRLTVAARF